MDNLLIPLGVIALEYDTTVNSLAKRFASQVTVENGIRVVPAAVAQRMHSERQARLQARREQGDRALAEQRRHQQETRGRVVAAQQHQARLRQEGLADGTTTAYQLMAGADGAAQLDAAGRHLDEMFQVSRDGGIGTMRTFNTKE